MTKLRETEGTPIWLPNFQEPHLVKRERRAYDSGDPQAQAMVETGLFETGKKFIFRCPLCGNQVANDQRLEPVCTGPSSWRDEHPMEPMVLVA